MHFTNKGYSILFDRSFNLDSAVQDVKAMQDFKLESLMMGADHSQMVKAAPIRSDYGSKDCVYLASSTAEFRFNNILLLICLAFLLFFLPRNNFVCAEEEYLDVETLSTMRTHGYSHSPYNKIVVFSALRSGSSLIYNVLHYLFEDDARLSADHIAFEEGRIVLKTHKFIDVDLKKGNDTLYVVPIRNPLDAAISTYRIGISQRDTIQVFARDVIKSQIRYLEFASKMKKSGCNIMILRYEEFVDNYDFLFYTIEKQFSIKIDSQDKELIWNGYGKKNVELAIKQLKNFKEYYVASGFHGKHISPDSYQPPEELVYWLNYYIDQNALLFSSYGYGNVIKSK